MISCGRWPPNSARLGCISDGWHSLHLKSHTSITALIQVNHTYQEPGTASLLDMYSDFSLIATEARKAAI